MSGEFEFSFDELPLIVDLGFEAGLVNGTATIRYEDDGEWFVRGIALDGSRQRTKAELVAGHAKGVALSMIEHRTVEIDRTDRQWLYAAITDQLENGRFKDQIDHKIIEEMGDAGTPRRDPNAEHSTLNRAQQGV